MRKRSTIVKLQAGIAVLALICAISSLSAYAQDPEEESRIRKKIVQASIEDGDRCFSAGKLNDALFEYQRVVRMHDVDDGYNMINVDGNIESYNYAVEQIKLIEGSDPEGAAPDIENQGP